MLLRILLLLALFCAAPAAAQQNEQKINDLVTAFMKRERVPGVAMVVLRRDQPVFERSWGTGRLGGIQPFYSVSKHVTAAVVLKLAEQGKLETNAPIGRYLPRWFADEPRLKVHHLLRHTSGLSDFIALPEVDRIAQSAPGTGSLADMLDIVDRLPRRFAPGARHAYSNGNYTALALLAETVAGTSFGALERDLLFAPLGLDTMRECAAVPARDILPGHDDAGRAVSLPPNPVPSFTGNGGLCGSATDLARWTRALGSGRVIGGPLLGDMRKGRRVSAGYTPPYGFGLSTKPLVGRPAWWHSGVDAGWGAFIAYLPEDEISLVILSSRGWLWSTDLAVPVLRVILDQSEPPAPERLPLSRRERAALHGKFEDGLFDMSIVAEPDRLLVSVEAFGPPIELWKQADGRFVSPARPDTFALRLARSGPVFDWAEHRSYLVGSRLPR